jgi:hypothetical protein
MSLDIIVPPEIPPTLLGWGGMGWIFGHCWIPVLKAYKLKVDIHFDDMDFIVRTNVSSNGEGRLDSRGSGVALTHT